ncbi:hypothetical protein ACFL60_02060 [Candidatus Omnitrophota bacterium]
MTIVTCAPDCPGGVVYEGYKNKLYQHEIMDGIDVQRVWTYIAANEEPSDASSITFPI